MIKKGFRFIFLLVFLFLTYCILTHSAQSLAFAANGLNLWYNNMIPALLPFMILSGTLIRMNLTEGFTTLVYPFVRLFFRVSQNVCYAMIMGFLCGFPMGAKCVSELYSSQKITKREASFLLAFCNNIGPVYFISFALPVTGCENPVIPLLGMYGLPLLYGLVLRYTLFRDLSCNSRPVPPASLLKEGNAPSGMAFLPALDESIYGAVQSMLMLGGYMILFNLIMLLPVLYMPRALPYVAPLLEISGGLSLLGTSFPAYSLIVLPFGGLSCVAQTYTCIKNTDLSLAEYIQHKLILTLLTVAYYLAYYFLLRFFLRRL